MVKSCSNTISSHDVAMVSGKLGIGAILVVLGIGGMAYAMPIESNSMVLDGNSPVIYQKAPHPPLPSSMVPYVGIVAASAASLALGIAFLAVGQTEVYKPTAPVYKAKEGKQENKQASQSSPKHTADAA
ncbi:hypothetical protein NTE_03000 [Candidatus Nitrososphaera evergladensis SR1]|jgi:hypothetical protein|uniref:Transmembrane protein n=1 Tax=Candidatus Nitrososphaera evergladensis SR1 TaxID=1459636 RepID=A0A075MUY7_9ARCH|nr:hypothetical protein [Candidatus Nitrososphaera evergladensis]AIF85035.1 hypothetical protein NTE_03000 [Candidatus Nitrososphaera evergladensis SR1]